MKTAFINTYVGCIVVIGSNGLIGSHLKTHLLRINSLNYCEEYEYSSCDYVKCNIELLARKSGKIKTCIIYAAGRSGFSLTSEESANDIVNFSSLLQQLVNYNLCSKFILMSSAGVFFSQLASSYQHLVMQREALLKQYFGGSSSVGLIVRLPSIFGINQENYKARGLPAVLLSNCKDFKQTLIYSSLSTRRNYLSVNSLMPKLIQLILSLENAFGEDPAISIFNFLHPTSFSVQTLIAYFKKHLSLTVRYSCIPSLPVHQEDHILSTFEGDGATIEINDDIALWIKTNYLKSFQQLT